LSDTLANRFEIREWVPGEAATLFSGRFVFSERLKGVTHFLSSAFRDLAMTKDFYYAPRPGNNFPFIDGCTLTTYKFVDSQNGSERQATGLVGFQMTIALEHDIKTGRRTRTYGTVFEEFLRKGNGFDKPLLIFVVPEEAFPTFSPMLPEAGIPRLGEIDIFIMKVPLNLRISQASASSETLDSQRRPLTIAPQVLPISNPSGQLETI
jgi:hypothetical protein